MSQVKKDNSLGGFELAYRIDGPFDGFGRCGFMFLTGFKSSMAGHKGEALATMARAERRPCLRFDYSGHGESGGLFVDGTISLWLEQALHMFITHTKGKVVLTGSSMGGWIALLLARRLKQEDTAAYRRLAGLVLLCPATDMTEALMWKRFNDHAKAEILQNGLYLEPSQYGGAYEITGGLIADGRKHSILAETTHLACPVRILQGTKDPDVPAEHAAETFAALDGDDVTLTYIKDGDHRLSRPGDLRFFAESALNLAQRADRL